MGSRTGDYRPTDPDGDGALFDTPKRAAMNANRSPTRDGRTCDQCGLPNLPRGWHHNEWVKYVDFPNSTSEGYRGLVLCGPCYAEHVEEAEGPARALAVLMELIRRDQARAAQARVAGISQAVRGRDGA